jgi:hypothetical protein
MAELADWNSRYQVVIPMEMAERKAGQVSALIHELDQEGLKLADHIARAARDESKVRYYSEGWLRYLP